MNNGITALRTPPAFSEGQSFETQSQEAQLTEAQLEQIEAASAEFFTPQRPNLPDFSEELLATSERRTCQRRKLSTGLAATIWEAPHTDNSKKEETDGKSVLLMHGWSGNSAQLNLFVAPLVEAGFRVVAVDALGHGRSPGQKSDCVAFATAIATAADEVGPFAHVIGHSLGAAAVMLALDCGLTLDSAVLISPPSILLVLQYFVAHKALPAAMLEPMTQAGERYVGKTRDEADSLLVSPRVETPLLLIHDDKDKRCPIAVSERIAADKPNRRLIKTSGLGHHHIIQSEAVVAEALNFLSVR